jgi:endogenous inhibitor of DNA gyrase (YacG/DUF329 family)
MERYTDGVKCPECGGEVVWDDTYDYEVLSDRYVSLRTGTCEMCQLTVEYNVIYPFKDRQIVIVENYKF